MHTSFIKNIKEKIGNKEILLIYNPKNLYYLCGIEGFGAVGLLTSEEFTLFLNENDYELFADRIASDVNVRIYKKGIVKDTIKGMEKTKEEIFVDNIYGEALRNLEKAIGRRIEISNVIERARMIKTDDEIENIRKACEIAKKGIEFAREIYLSEKRISEHNLAAEVEYFMKKKGSEGTFEDGILLACGKNAAHIHAKPSHKIIDKAMLIDLGAKFNNYFSDLSRTFTERADNEIKKHAEFIENLERECIDKIYTGMKISEISKFADKKIKENGFKLLHSLGHGVGLEVHELPYINNNSEMEFRESMVFTIEPGIYKADKFGIRFEDTCVIKNGKAKIL